MTTLNARELGFDEERLARVARAIEADIAAERCDGASLVVARGGHIALDLVQGFAERGTGRRLGRDAVFVTMSVGKQLTNTAVLALVERGLLQLHQPVAEVLPGFGALGKERVTLFQLLTHTSGITSAIPVVPPDVLMDIPEKHPGITHFALSCPDIMAAKDRLEAADFPLSGGPVRFEPGAR